MNEVGIVLMSLKRRIKAKHHYSTAYPRRDEEKAAIQRVDEAVLVVYPVTHLILYPSSKFLDSGFLHKATSSLGTYRFADKERENEKAPSTHKHPHLSTPPPTARLDTSPSD